MYGVSLANYYVYAWPFTHRLHFIYAACQIYLRTSVRTYKLRDSRNPSGYSHARLKAMLNETICSEIFRATMLVQQLKAMRERCVALQIYVANCSL